MLPLLVLSILSKSSTLVTTATIAQGEARFFQPFCDSSPKFLRTVSAITLCQGRNGREPPLPSWRAFTSEGKRCTYREKKSGSQEREIYGILCLMKAYSEHRQISHPRGLLFDMDGVLLLTSQSPAQSWQEVACSFAPALDLSAEALFEALQRSYQSYQRTIAHDPEQQRRDRLAPFETRLEVVEDALASLHRVHKEMAVEMVRAYERLRDTHRFLAPHALEVLQFCRQRSLALALVTNGNATYQRRKIAQHGLASWFDAVLIEEEVGIAKPDPRIFLQALERLHLRASEAWMIGDDLTRDIAGAQQVGLLTIWYDASGSGLSKESPVHPDWMVHDLAELCSLLTP